MKLTQEDINSMMMTPGEGYRLRNQNHTELPKCPHCGEEYCGDGVELCLDCEALLSRLKGDNQ